MGGDDTKTHLTLGFSENNSRFTGGSTSGAARSGVGSDGNKRTTGGGNWQKAFNNAYLPSIALQFPALLMFRWRVQCLQGSTNGPGGQAIYPNTPASNSEWPLFRWSFANSSMTNSTYCCSGIRVGSSNTGVGKNTPIFEEFGLISGSVDYGLGTGSTKLFRKWMGADVSGIQTEAKADGSWRREFTNCLVIANPSLDNSITIDVSEFPGGSSEWKRFNGTQDSSTNDGTDASSDFTLNKIDAIFLVRKSWYDAL